MATVRRGTARAIAPDQPVGKCCCCFFFLTSASFFFLSAFCFLAFSFDFLLPLSPIINPQFRFIVTMVPRVVGEAPFMPKRCFNLESQHLERTHEGIYLVRDLAILELAVQLNQRDQL